MTTIAKPQGYMRLQDLAGPPAGNETLTLDWLAGTWRHTDPEPHGICETRIASAGDALMVECVGFGGPLPRHSPPVRANTIFAANPSSRDGVGFFADFKFDGMSSRFQGNVNLGLLVLAGFHDFNDGSARSNYFSREFFYSVSGESASLPSSNISLQGSGSGRLDVSSLVGLWRNTTSASTGIVTIQIREEREGLAVRSFGAGKTSLVDWGETSAKVYAKDWVSTEAMAFYACFDAGELSCHLQANVKQGVLVVAYFTVFNDGSGRSNYFSREFYYKDK